MKIFSVELVSLKLSLFFEFYEEYHNKNQKTEKKKHEINVEIFNQCFVHL